MLESVLITGATGFLGGRIRDRLLAEGTRVTAVSRGASGSREGDWRTCDLEDAEAVQRLFHEVRPSHVLHLASLVTGSRDVSAVLPTFRANLAAAVHLLTAAVQAGCKRVVLAGSMEELPADAPGRYPYAAAKRAAGDYGRFFHRAYGLSAITLRIGMVYGPGDRRTAGFIPHVILSQLGAIRPRLSSGKRQVDWVFVDDVADAFLAAARATDDASGAVLEIGTGRAVSLAEVAARLTAITGGPEPELGALPDRASDVDIAMDAETTAKVIGWRSRVELDDGLRRTVDWYRAERAAGRL
jgi:UDP-glucose 4-epimerase